MSAKQDRTAPRTAADIERKYNFGKSFAEVLGLIDDTRKDVESVESSVKGVADQYTALKRDTEQIVIEAHRVEQKLDDSIEAVNNTVTTITSDLDAKIDADSFELKFNQMLNGGVDNIVIKNRDFAFDYDGLTIADSTSDLSTNVDIDGMQVKQNGNPILTAGAVYHDDGKRTIEVRAANLHATTYLKVGSGDGHSRFEDYGINRIGCFWTGE
jgi:hypothetical protein